MKKLFLLSLVLSAWPLFAQNVRYDAPASGSNAIVNVCSSPANGIPCTNFATTYNSLGVACPNSAQDTPQPQPSNCQATVDTRGWIGFWAPAGTYDYTVCIGSSCNGPYTVTLAGSSSSPPGAQQIFNAKPTPVGFNTVQTSTTSQPQNITFSSQGTIGVTISASQTGSSDFVFSNLHGCDGLQSAGAVCSLTLTFQPSSTGPKTGNLLIATDIPTNPLITIPLSGTGTAATTFPLTVTAIDNGFGTIRSGETIPLINCTVAPPSPPTGSCGPINYANGTPVHLTATALAGSTFESLNGAGCSVSPCDLTMASPGFTVAVDFSANGPAAIAQIVVAPSTLLFGKVQTATPSPAQPIAISNPSQSVPLTVNSVVSSDSHFAASPNIHACDGIYLPGATCVLPIVFTPTSGISFNGTVTVNSNAPVNPSSSTTVTVSGLGTATATFPLTVNASSTMTGSGTVTSNEATPLINCTLSAGLAPSGQCSNNYASGSSVILTATPGLNQTFGGFSGTGCGTTSPSTVTVTAATTCTVNFTAPIPTNTLSIAGIGQGTGTVVSDLHDVVDGQIINCTSTASVRTGKCNGVFNRGSTVILTETPSGSCAGGACTFTAFTNCPAPTATTCPITVSSNLTVGANFALPAAGAPIGLAQSINGGVSHGNWSPVQSQAGVAPTGNTCTATVAATGTGNLLVGVGWPALGVTLTGVSGGGTWTVDANGNHLSYAHAAVSTPGATTVTFTFSGSSTSPDFGCRVYEVANPAGAVLDTVTTPTTNAICTTCPGATPTVAGNNDIIFQFSAQNNGANTSAISGGYSFNGDVSGAAGFRLGSGFLLNTTSTAVPNWTVAPASALVVGALTFKENTANVFGNFGSAQSSGNTNIVYVTWNDATTTISGITDTSGNTYTQSACSPKAANSLSEALYYAPGIAAAGAGSNTIKVGFSATPTVRNIYALEYSGLTATPVDVCAGATGASGNPASGNLTTNFANDLLTAGTNLASGHSITGIASGWTQKISNAVNDVEDQEGVAIGTYANAPTQNSSGAWIDIAAAWKNGGGGAPTTFSFNVACGAGAGTGSVSSGGSTLTCTNGVPTSGGISLSVAANSVQTVTANPQIGSSFFTYSGAGCGTSPSCTTSAITINTTVTVVFSLNGTQAFFVNSSTGSDSNDGLAATAGGGHGPWRTVGKADTSLTLGASGICAASSGWLSVPNAGACVHVNGNIVGPITTTKSGTATQRIVYISDTKQAVHITNPDTGTTSPSWNVEAPYIDLDGFDITAVATSCITIHQEVPQFMPHDVHLIGNYCHDIELAADNCHNGGAFQTGGAQPTSPSDPFPANNWYIGNVIRHGGNPSSHTGGGPFTNCFLVHGVYTHGGSEIFQDNVISGMAGTGIAIIGMSGMNGTVVTGNTIFNNNGGVYVDNCSDSGCANGDFLNLSNNVIVQNGVGTVAPSIQFGGLSYRFTGTHNIASNNLIYGNLPRDIGLNSFHLDTCGTSASGSTPSTGGTACPNSNAKTDSGGTSATFSAFHTDFNQAPDGSYDVQHYTLKASPPSNGVNGGSSLCANPPTGITPCMPTADFNGVNRPVGPALDIGAFEQ